MHNKNIEEVLKDLNTSLSGLSESQAEYRLRLYGPNELEEGEESKLRVFLRQFTSPLVIVLLLAGFLSLLLGELKDSIAIYGLVLVNGLLGFYQELRALTSLRALKSITALKAKVLRDKDEKEIDIRLLVPGDIIFLREGDIVPADIRLVESVAVQVDEAILTGESFPVEKMASLVLQEDTPIFERVNCLYRGTVVAKGRAVGVIFATGRNTEIGKIARRMVEPSPESPLTKAIDILAKRWVLVLVLLLSSLFVIGLLQGREIKVMFLFVLAQLVSAVPEGLPIVITVTLVVGALRLSRHKTLVKYLPSVETLGSATYICADKTGTVTEGKLRVERYYSIDKFHLFMCAALCNDSDGIRGDPIEVALLEWLGRERFGWPRIREVFERVWEYPFDAKKRFMAVVVKNGDSYDLYVKGAFESLLEMCKECPKEIVQVHDSYAQSGLRVLAFGHSRIKRIPHEVHRVKIDLVGVVGFLDPPKSGVYEAVKRAREAGIRVVMITGDNILTAKAVASMINIYRDQDIALEGKDLDRFSNGELYSLLRRTTVVARASPDDKYRIVKVLQQKGEIVAVTGDGVNDVPALKTADLGVAMGSGSSAAKDAAKMIITDNNLSVIVEAIKTGRHIAKNIGTAIRYLLSTNAFEVMYVSLAILLGFPLPFYATQVLWINLVTDGVQDKVFPFTKYEGDPMKERPKKPQDVLVGRQQLFKILYNSVFITICHILLFAYLLQTFSYEQALTISFISSALSQFPVGIQEISDRPFFRNPLKFALINPYIFLSVLLGVSLQMVAISFLSEYFHAVRLEWEHIRYALLIPIFTFLAIELRKYLSHLMVFQK
ncbi:MAG: cation-translocating P-type ATPase [Aquificaceae bacterium]